MDIGIDGTSSCIRAVLEAARGWETDTTNEVARRISRAERACDENLPEDEAARDIAFARAEAIIDDLRTALFKAMGAAIAAPMPAMEEHRPTD